MAEANMGAGKTNRGKRHGRRQQNLGGRHGG
jgi:hypothetical protein